MTHHAATAFWYNNDLYKNNDLGRDKAKEYLNSLFDYIIPLIETGKELYNQKRLEQKAKANVISIANFLLEIGIKKNDKINDNYRNKER